MKIKSTKISSGDLVGKSTKICTSENIPLYSIKNAKLYVKLVDRLNTEDETVEYVNEAVRRTIASVKQSLSMANGETLHDTLSRRQLLNSTGTTRCTRCYQTPFCMRIGVWGM